MLGKHALDERGALLVVGAQQSRQLNLTLVLGIERREERRL
jgi:hypothetical protein